MQGSGERQHVDGQQKDRRAESDGAPDIALLVTALTREGIPPSHIEHVQQLGKGKCQKRHADQRIALKPEPMTGQSGAWRVSMP